MKKIVRKHFYIALALSPILLLSGCRPVDWLKEKLGMCQCQEKKNAAGKKGREHLVAGEWVVKVGDDVIVSSDEFQAEFNLLLDEKPQLKSMLPLMPNLEKDFAKGLGNQEIIARYVEDKKLDQTPGFIAKKARMERAVKQMLNAEFFAQAFDATKVSDEDVKKFYEDNKDSMQGIMISRGGVNAAGVSFDKKIDAEVFLKKAKAAGKDLDIQTFAKGEGLSDNARDFKLINEQSFGIDPVLRTKIMTLKEFPTVDMIATSENSFWVVHASSKEETKYRTFEQVKEGVRNVAEQTEKGKMLQQELEKLTQNYGMEINEQYFQKEVEQEVVQTDADEDLEPAQVLGLVEDQVEQRPEPKAA